MDYVSVVFFIMQNSLFDFVGGYSTLTKGFEFFY